MSYSDIDIIDRFNKGDRSAFEDLVRANQNRIYNLCRYTLGNDRDADDAAQDTFVKAYLNLKNFKPQRSIYSWLVRIAVNTCIDYKRRPRAQSTERAFGSDSEATFEVGSTTETPEDAYRNAQLKGELERSLSKLSIKLRAIIVLREIDGLSYEEIAEISGISIGTVKSRISRAKAELKQDLSNGNRVDGFLPQIVLNKKPV